MTVLILNLRTATSLKRLTCSMLLVSAVVASACWAQPVQAQVIQLPSFRSFSYSGSAWVPDAGTTALGGTSYSARSSASRGLGPFANRSSASSGGATSLTASARIIDLQALDEAILSANVPKSTQPAAVPAADANSVEGGRSFLGDLANSTSGLPVRTSRRIGADPGGWQRALSGSGVGSPAHPSLAEADIRYYLQQGREAEKSNRIQASRVYYQMALDAMTPQMQERYQRILVERQAADEEKRKAEADQTGRRSF